MAKKTVDLHEAQTRFLELLSLTAEGTEVIITENNKPLARLVSMAPSPKPRAAGLHPGAIWTSTDFDEPLPNGFWIGAT